MKFISSRLRFALLAVLLLAFGTFAITPQRAYAAAQPTQSTSSLVSGTTSSGGVLSGVLKITNFSTQNNRLLANGVLNGTITNADGTVTQVVNQAINGLQVTSASGSCQILNLTLGPLDLNLLGLQVHLNQVVLNITAVPGAGNLLGNLLCDVAGLLNGGNLSGLLTNVSGLLTQIVGLLNGL